MKNFEKYIESIAKVLTTQDCEGMQCDKCELANLCDRQDEEYTKKWLLAEYVEPIKLTHDEYVILKNVKIYKWIARDTNNSLFVYVGKPKKMNARWNNVGKDWEVFGMYEHLFQFIKWEDEEPYEIAKLIADYESNNQPNKTDVVREVYSSEVETVRKCGDFFPLRNREKENGNE